MVSKSAILAERNSSRWHCSVVPGTTWYKNLCVINDIRIMQYSLSDLLGATLHSFVSRGAFKVKLQGVESNTLIE